MASAAKGPRCEKTGGRSPVSLPARSWSRLVSVAPDLPSSDVSSPRTLDSEAGRQSLACLSENAHVEGFAIYYPRLGVLRTLESISKMTFLLSPKAYLHVCMICDRRGV